MIRTFTRRLTTNCSAIELCFPVVPVRFELTTLPLKAGYIFQLSYETICCGYWIWTNTIYRIRVMLCRWAKPHFVAITGLEPVSAGLWDQYVTSYTRSLFYWLSPGIEPCSYRSQRNALPDKLKTTSCGSYGNWTHFNRSTICNVSRYSNEPFITEIKSPVVLPLRPGFYAEKVELFFSHYTLSCLVISAACYFKHWYKHHLHQYNTGCISWN